MYATSNGAPIHYLKKAMSDYTRGWVNFFDIIIQGPSVIATTSFLQLTDPEAHRNLHECQSHCKLEGCSGPANLED
jgi:hypothetical protein